VFVTARQALGSALIASAVGIVASYAVRLFFAVLTPAETYGDRLTQLIPLAIFSHLLAIFGSSAKHWYLGGVTLAEVILTACIGALYWGARGALLARSRDERGASAQPPPGAMDVAALAALLYALSAGVLAPIIGGGLAGASLAGGALGTLGSEAVPVLTFAACFVLLLRRADPQSIRAAALPSTAGRSPRQLGRRRLLRETAIALGVLAAGALTWEALASGLGSALGIAGPRKPRLSLGAEPERILPPPVPSYGPWSAVQGQTPEVTATGDFYYVSKNLVGDPSVDSATWRLDIGGAVNAPYALSYADLQALPRIERYHTLECISNEVGGNLMSNGLFSGVSLADLLNRAGIRRGANEVIFQAADGYSDRLHLSQALDERSLVVFLLNGRPLPQAHGFPARLLIPGLYGMKNGKWLTSLHVATGDYTGYWEQQGWTREANVKMTSRIDVPHDGDLLVARPSVIAGVAFAADKGIARVDVSTDGGQTWQAATLRRPLGALTWVLWELAWTPTGGQHVLVVRAIDQSGTVQTPAETPPLPDGATGYDAISVVVR
jgi:DMSO/TMAO reductase YedYZ molybdopterin-dependent catalytic subunit